MFLIIKWYKAYVLCKSHNPVLYFESNELQIQRVILYIILFKNYYSIILSISILNLKNAIDKIHYACYNMI